MRYKIILQYDGTHYYGWEKQINAAPTIQGIIEAKLQERLNLPISIVSSGRTDRGVHALGQCCLIAHPELQLPPQGLRKILNNILPDDLFVQDCILADNNFHPRFSALAKQYLYRINLGRFNLFQQNYCYQYNQPIDVQKIREIIPLFIGTKNFLSFSTSELSETTRTVFDFKCQIENNILEITVRGNGFLKNMVRMLVGTLIAYSEARITVEQIKDCFQHPAKGKAHWKAPACGLYLQFVQYE